MDHRWNGNRTASVHFDDCGLEEKLLQIERGKYSLDAFMTEIEAMASNLITNYQVVKDASVIIIHGYIRC